LGISLIAPKYNNLHWLKDYEHLVFHLILGIHNNEIVDKLMEEFPETKVLFLGYKQYGNGADYYSDAVQSQIDYWRDNLVPYFFKLKVASFDNLALKQLELEKRFSPEIWQEQYMGDDATFTFFMDLIEGKFCGSSTTKDRHNIGNLKIVDMLQIIRKEKENATI
jgi:hypothetical protein